MLIVEYLGRIEYDYQKSRVTGPWDHKDSVSAKKVKKKCHACVPLKTLFHAKQHFSQILKLMYTNTLVVCPPSLFQNKGQ